MNASTNITPALATADDDTILTEIAGNVGLITLNRPKALNALSLPMVRLVTRILLAWRADPQVHAVAIRAMGRDGPFGAFCAGGDIRFFHAAATAGDPLLEDFFTEEYQLNHLIHHYPKPFIAFMDGIIMGGGMGLAQGAVLRIVTERTKMAMPETLIGLFPDVGGGYFMSRCPGTLGEYLALTGQILSGAEAVHATLADLLVDSAMLPALWAQLPTLDWASGKALALLRAAGAEATAVARMTAPAWWTKTLQGIFAGRDLHLISHTLTMRGTSETDAVLAVLRKRSPLLLHVSLELIRRARTMKLADELRLERDLVRHCFHPVHLGGRSETVEGVRALAIDKDNAPRWQPATLEEVTTDMVTPFFVSPWPASAHPLRDLSDA